MRTLVHLSDLHFGRVQQGLIEPLTALIARIAPDVLIVSGDLTQRARPSEFVAARAFLDTLPKPQIVVPGNHDISLYNLCSRFLRPLTKYTRYITNDLAPYYVDDEIAVTGVNTARALTIKDGRINDEQIAQIRARFLPLPKKVIKVVVTHHPFDLPGHFARNDLVKRAATAVGAFAECGTDMLLAGHLHATHAGTTDASYPLANYSALVVQAGTATSTRGRGEANSFNVIRLDYPHITIDRYAWQESQTAFECAGQEHFKREGESWRSLKSDE